MPGAHRMAEERIKEGRLTAATALLEAARKQHRGHSELSGVQGVLASAKSAAEAAHADYRREASASIRSAYHRRFDVRFEEVARQWSDREPAFERIAIKGLAKGECHPSLAGYGKRRVCYDKVARGGGPELICCTER